jgi:hypothetical protein
MPDAAFGALNLKREVVVEEFYSLRSMATFAWGVDGD